MPDKTQPPTETTLSPAQTDAIRRLTEEVERLNSHRFVKVHNSVFRLIGFQFARGLAVGLGSVLGASSLVSLLAWWLAQIEFLPIIGEWATRLVQEIDMPRGPNGGGQN